MLTNILNKIETLLEKYDFIKNINKFNSGALSFEVTNNKKMEALREGLIAKTKEEKRKYQIENTGKWWRITFEAKNGNLEYEAELFEHCLRQHQYPEKAKDGSRA